jgi:hypothetical protein
MKISRLGWQNLYLIPGNIVLENLSENKPKKHIKDGSYKGKCLDNFNVKRDPTFSSHHYIYNTVICHMTTIVYKEGYIISSEKVLVAMFLYNKKSGIWVTLSKV